jgi:hypothetical protein
VQHNAHRMIFRIGAVFFMGRRNMTFQQKCSSVDSAITRRRNPSQSGFRNRSAASVQKKVGSCHGPMNTFPTFGGKPGFIEPERFRALG